MYTFGRTEYPNGNVKIHHIPDPNHDHVRFPFCVHCGVPLSGIVYYWGDDHLEPKSIPPPADYVGGFSCCVDTYLCPECTVKDDQQWAQAPSNPE